MKTAMNIVFSLVASLIATPALAHMPDPTDDGWVRHVEGSLLEICYRSTPPTIGDTVQILRVSYINSNKGPVQAQYSLSGTARITAGPNEKGCESAELIEGKAKRTDHARLAGH